MKPRYRVVAGAIKSKEGKVLIVKRPLHKKHGGLWEFPGGKLEKGETPEEALKRELKEELNLEINSAKFLGKVIHDYGEFEIELFLFEVDGFKGQPELKEAIDMKWIFPEEATQFELCPADKKLLAFF